ncbi:MAG: MOSC N-terminal beta barrel domain-containing protein [Spongiibacteraceae bacterium]
MLTVSELTIYPVKSLGAINLSRMQIDDFGPADDRRFVVVDRNGRFVTQRDYPRMTLVTLMQREGFLDFSAPDMPIFSLALPRNVADERQEVVVWRDRIKACDMGDAIAAWLSSYLGCEVRLYYMPNDTVRAVDPQYGRAGDRVSFADGFPVLLIGAASLDELNRALPEPITSLRFRPNIVVAGAEPYAEDTWKRVRIGAIEFDVVKPCSRCVIPSIDPISAEKQPVVAQTLARLRMRDRAIYFGQNLIPRGHGEIALGDEVRVVA